VKDAEDAGDHQLAFRLALVWARQRLAPREVRWALRAAWRARRLSLAFLDPEAFLAMRRKRSALREVMRALRANLAQRFGESLVERRLPAP
jgi:hypothetical protein